MTTCTYVDIHVLQTVPPSNLNRDDAGSPKQAIYGGVRRARVSSQAWKRAARKAFAEQVPPERLATRTKKISGLLSDRLIARTGMAEEHATRLATTLLSPLKITPGRKAAETAYLLFFGRPQLERLVDEVADRADDLAALDDEQLKDALKDVPVRDILSSGHPIDVALFGRMVADLPGLNVDAATQVAHALSTHQVELEFDYYTAVDDENPKEDTGAGMIGTVEFNSATLYRFATVGVHQLIDNLGGDVEAAMEALRVFVSAFVTSMPTGHENSFAHRTTPSLVSVVVRDDQPVNLVSAFEAPVRADERGIAQLSALRLAEEMSQASTLWGLTPLNVASTYSGGDHDTLRQALGDSRPFPAVVDQTVTAVRRHVAGQGS
ncbi:type I-E CRISPR-associated protein Cas7/Cse4/CasC [Kineosporiaceae bacterium SCSIO 59966]|nr:type I-E CRISPR-associated protein Cas7/Cse4/CasC [Kineosporiaceae bacterium SCSIO 59966]